MSYKILFFLLLSPALLFAADWDINQRLSMPAGPVGQCMIADENMDNMTKKYTASSQEFNYLRRYAAGGDKTSMCILGLTYIEGKKTPQNVELGIEWLTKAADIGLPANIHLYRIYREGILVPQDKELAFHYLKQSADLPNYEAYCYTAREYVLGEIVEMNLATASTNYEYANYECPASEIREYRELTKSKAIVNIIFRMVLPSILVLIFMLVAWIFLIKQTRKLRKS